MSDERVTRLNYATEEMPTAAPPAKRSVAHNLSTWSMSVEVFNIGAFRIFGCAFRVTVSWAP
jgi:hypothetical protein